jgi:hypothetical protein
MSQQGYSYSRPSDHRRSATRRSSAGYGSAGRTPTGRTQTIGPQPKRRIWPLVVLIVLEFLFLLSMVALWLWSYLAMPNYVELNDNIVAQVQLFTTRKPHLMYANVTLYDKDHNPTTSIHCYMMQGTRLVFQGDVLIFAPWQNSNGLHSGYKLTQLTGCYSDATFQGGDIMSDLNGGEDGFFRMAQGYTLYAQLVQVQAYYSRPVFLVANLPVGQKSGTFNVFTSQEGLHAVPLK